MKNNIENVKMVCTLDPIMTSKTKIHPDPSILTGSEMRKYKLSYTVFISNRQQK